MVCVLDGWGDAKSSVQTTWGGDRLQVGQRFEPGPAIALGPSKARFDPSALPP